ncbi:MAG: ATP-binding protein [Abditibacteriaceae bacterium]
MADQLEQFGNQSNAAPHQDARWNLVVPGTSDSLPQIRDLVIHITRCIHFDEEMSGKIEMAVDEACANIVEHAYRDQKPPGEIELRAQAFSDRLEISILDHAHNDFPVDSKPYMGIDEYISSERRRGMGLFIIHSFMDDVRHRYVAGHGNELLLVKYIA